MSGYVLFVAQMTAKIRHDRPHVHHNQIAVVREISKICKYRMSDVARDLFTISLSTDICWPLSN